MVPQTREKPFHRSEEFKDVRRIIHRLPEGNETSVHVCFFEAPFGVVPLELDEVYPLSQHEVALPLDCEVKDYVAAQVAAYIERTTYRVIVLINDSKTWGNSILRKCKNTCHKKGLPFELLTLGAQTTKEYTTSLETLLKKHMGESA